MTHHTFFFSFKQRPNISLYVEYSRTLSWVFEDFKSAYKATKFYAKWLVRITVLTTKTCTNFTSQKICCVKSGFEILYAVEQFSLLSSKDKLKQGAHIHQTHDPPSPRMSWENCRAVPSKQLPHMCCVELALIGLASAGKGFPRSLTDGYALLMSPVRRNTSHMCCVELALDRLLCTRRKFPPFINRTALPRCWHGPQQGRNSCPWLSLPAWYGCAHAWGTGPTVGWSIGAPCLDLHYFQCNRIKFNLFFINYCISWGF